MRAGQGVRTGVESRWIDAALPDFDLCRSPVQTSYDVVLCNQVLEHVLDPFAAARKLRALTAPGGIAVVATPFLLRPHDAPVDLWRFTELGLRTLLTEAGFTDVEVHSWGNAACVRSNLYRWTPMAPWRSLRNDPHLPVVVWAFAS